jgi:alpha-1,2-mannosyltransferase
VWIHAFVQVEALRLHAQQLGIEHRVEWQLNIPFDKLCDELSHAFIGVHTMYNEHFGIGTEDALE